MADRDWDLSAVVRSWVPAASSAVPRPAAADIHSNPPASSSAATTFVNFQEEDEVGCAHQSFTSFRFPSLTEPQTGFDELHQLYMPFLPRVDEKPSTLGLRACRAGPGLAPKRIGIAPAPASAPIVDEKKQQMMMHGQVLQLHQKSTAAPQQTPRMRKRKSQQKKNVCHVSAENLSSDLWAWRKYGQKPIKGSPYPRNYYRCSSSKGCGARKQVERSNVDPNMFIVTYTGEHTHPRPTHRNSLAGSTRNKFTGALQKAQSASHPDDPGTKPATLSPTTPLTAPIDVDGGANSQQGNQYQMADGAPNMEDKEPIDDEDLAISDYEADLDDEDLLIPNIANNINHEDMFVGFHELIHGNIDVPTPNYTCHSFQQGSD